MCFKSLCKLPYPAPGWVCDCKIFVRKLSDRKRSFKTLENKKNIEIKNKTNYSAN